MRSSPLLLPLSFLLLPSYMFWQIKGRTLSPGDRTLVMGVLNVTPDSFSDGSQFYDREAALTRALRMIDEGADIIDIGGESTRPGAGVVSVEEEIERVVPVIEALADRTSVPISIDTTKSAVAAAALAAGAAIVNDISALRFDFQIADEVAKVGAGLVLMHSRGTPATMQRLPPVADVLDDVVHSLRSSLRLAERRGVSRECIAIDPGIGFGKTGKQNIELLAKLDQLAREFPEFPLVIGTSRKSFIGHLLADENGDPAPVEERLHGSMASVTAAILRGTHIVRVHDVRAAVETARVADSIKRALEAS
jgi:dihydropteroate synthase